MLSSESNKKSVSKRGTSVRIVKDKDERKYRGQYVATRSFKDITVVSHGSNPLEVIRKAHKGGARNPVINFVPKKPLQYLLKGQKTKNNAF